MVVEEEEAAEDAAAAADELQLFARELQSFVVERLPEHFD